MAQNQLMQEVAKKKFKIILSGTGADEIFSGYYDHYRQFISTLKKKEQKKNIFYWKKYYVPKIRNLKLKDHLSIYKQKLIWTL